MIDFLMIATRTGKRGVIEIYPKFIIKKSKDLMIRGSDFYAAFGAPMNRMHCSLSTGSLICMCRSISRP